MIFDKLENWKYYFKQPIFQEIYEKLESLNENTSNGNYFKCEDYYFKVLSYSTCKKPIIIESHKQEVDIQIILTGSEKIKIYSTDQVELTQEYTKDIDCQFYKTNNKPNIDLTLSTGYFAIFFPQDIHACQFKVDNEIKIKKIVIKVNEKFFT